MLPLDRGQDPGGPKVLRRERTCTKLWLGSTMLWLWSSRLWSGTTYIKELPSYRLIPLAPRPLVPYALPFSHPRSR
jgi:hypothetical protein